MLTVADVLALPVLAAGEPQVRTGRDRLDVPVRWVHVTEQVDVAGLLGGGELLLTTGMGWAAGDFDVAAYVASLVEAGVVGVVVELTEHLGQVPPELVHAARAAQLPLVELHRVVRFVEVTEQVHGRLLHDQYDRLRFADRVHATFASLGVVGTRVEEVLDRAAGLLGGPVVLEDLAHRVVAHVAGPVGTAELLVDWSRRSRRDPGSQGWVVVPAGPPGDRWGRLVAPGPRAAPDPLLVLDRAAEALTVVRLIAGGPPEGEDLARRAHDDLVRDLLRARRDDEPALRQRLRALGLSPRTGFAAAAVVGADRREVSAALARTRSAGLTGTVGRGEDPTGSVVGVLLVGSARVVTAALDRLAAALPGAATLGAAEPVTELHATREGLEEARHVAQVAAAAPRRAPGRVHRTADLGVRGLVWRLRGDARLAAFAEAQLAPLFETPEDLGLLADYLQVNGSMTRLAGRLHLSRPAAYGRVDRLTRRLGRDLEDPEVRLGLHLALLSAPAPPPPRAHRGG
ncbi:PucR family transcriptional regulator ligand-binding domain-containing protein [Kineococcus sp. TBRC 1896]|uniref:PucR family transcriptional regulator ligand-binding domain-containing protein n=1 Tax=Kineococcus mangrovi TaxID=1660183 RepID=A0ABV4I339_9ACTN